MNCGIRSLLLILITISNFTVYAQRAQYDITLDLTKTREDRILVDVLTPMVSNDTVEFRIPKIVPGTYAIYDFGRFIHDFKAFDKEGNPLPVGEITANRRLIFKAKNLHRLSYWVEDTYDTKQDNVIFEPAGTNIENNKNYVINTFGYFGYLKGYKNTPYKISIAHDPKHYGSTSLDRISSDPTTDVFISESYVALADEPIMYCKPDTTRIRVGNTDVLTSVYSPNGKLTSKFVMDNVKEILYATKRYLGDSLPVTKYAFIFYLTQNPTLSKSFGALEHSYSSFYVLPEVSPFLLAQTIKDVAAHEFFHIVTPLNVHSEEIGNFDFINPSMSKHLWLYEGVTEYFAGHVQITNDVIDSVAYLKILKGKIDNSLKYKRDLPFTEMSKTCLEENKDQYLNVYEKGALIGLHIDILLREASSGEYGLVDLLADLSDRYGKDKSFKDDALFDIIRTLTYPVIYDFLTTYVSGSKELDFEAIFQKVGIDYEAAKTYQGLTMGNLSFAKVSGSNLISIRDTKEMNEFGKNMGYEKGDILFKFNKQKITLDNIKTVVDDFKATSQTGDIVSVIVKRKDDKGKLKKKKLSAAAMEITLRSNTNLEFSQNPSKEQLKLRQWWLRN